MAKWGGISPLFKPNLLSITPQYKFQSKSSFIWCLWRCIVFKNLLVLYKVLPSEIDGSSSFFASFHLFACKKEKTLLHKKFQIVTPISENQNASPEDNILRLLNSSNCFRGHWGWHFIPTIKLTKTSLSFLSLCWWMAEEEN